MALTPLDIHHKEFRTARFGGYNEEEVDSFLDQVADEFEKLTQDNVELGQQVEADRRRGWPSSRRCSRLCRLRFWPQPSPPRR